MPVRTPTQLDVLSKLREGIMRDLRVHLVARVESYDPSTQRATVQPLITDFFEEDDDTVSQVKLPIVTVSTMLPGAGGYRITFPVAKGDTVLLAVLDRTLDVWLSQGGEQAPTDTRRHDLSDSVMFLGLHDSKHPWTGVASDGMTLGKDGGPLVTIKAGTIELGGADSAIARADLVDTRLNDLRTALNNWMPVPSDGGAALKAALTAWLAGSLACGSSTGKVKA